MSLPAKLEAPSAALSNFVLNLTRNLTANETEVLCGSGNTSVLLWGICGDNTTVPSNCTDGDPSCQTVAVALRFWVLILFVFPIFTVFGNILVVIAVSRERSLQTVTNYFIVSLAFADIMLAVSVMPLAAWVEVAATWPFSDLFCDIFVMFDVMFCTASILNLAAISIDRFVAVTQPIKYSKSKHSQGRVYLTIFLAWAISISIALPIGIGMNRTAIRTKMVRDFGPLCKFFNPDFLIYSSLGSFYIPCFIMILLYHKIFKVIHARAKKQHATRKAKTYENRMVTTLKKENHNNATTTTTTTTVAAADFTTAAAATTKTTVPNNNAASTACSSLIVHQTEINTNNKQKLTIDTSTVTANTAALMHEDHRLEVADADKPSNSGSGVSSQLPYVDDPLADRIDEEETGFTTDRDQANHVKINPFARRPSPPRTLHKDVNPVTSPHTSPGAPNYKSKSTFSKHLTINFKRKPKKKKDRSAAKKERKATKTLAIVLGVFLFCWLPFFSMNMIDALCLKFPQRLSSYPMCSVPPYIMSMLVWLGYVNSFLNPVIYTIFNAEFRRAFKKILSGAGSQQRRGPSTGVCCCCH